MGLLKRQNAEMQAVGGGGQKLSFMPSSELRNWLLDRLKERERAGLPPQTMGQLSLTLIEAGRSAWPQVQAVLGAIKTVVISQRFLETKALMRHYEGRIKNLRTEVEDIEQLGHCTTCGARFLPPEEMIAPTETEATADFEPTADGGAP